MRCAGLCCGLASSGLSDSGALGDVPVAYFLKPVSQHECCPGARSGLASSPTLERFHLIELAQIKRCERCCERGGVPPGEQFDVADRAALAYERDKFGSAIMSRHTRTIARRPLDRQ